MPDNDGVVKHAGWLPSNPSMDTSGGLAPGWDGLSGGAAGDEVVKSAGQTMGSTPMSESPGTVSSRIMEDVEYQYPGSGQGNLEPTGPRVKGA